MATNDSDAVHAGAGLVPCSVSAALVPVEARKAVPRCTLPPRRESSIPGPGPGSGCETVCSGCSDLTRMEPARRPAAVPVVTVSGRDDR
jgi:hypothetical protein